MSVHLSKDQEHIINEMMQFITKKKHTEHQFLVFSGFAGTGKTTVIIEVIKRLNAMEFNIGKIAITAPTNQAVKVVSDKFNAANVDWIPTLATIHSTLGLKMTWNNEIKELTEKEKSKNKNPFESFGVVFIDEASMIDDELLKRIIRKAGFRNTLVIFVGDREQLEPVGNNGDESKVWSLKALRLSLTKIERFNESSILRLSQAIREGDFDPSRLDYDNALTLSDNRKAFLDKIKSQTDDFYNCKILSYTNASVETYNKFFREHKFEKGVKQWIAGDWCITGDAVSINDEYFIPTSTEGIVTDVCERIHPKHKELNLYEIEVELFDGDKQYFNVVPDESKKTEQKIRAKLLEDAKTGVAPWRNYYRYVESIHDIRHNYALTIHKSQGSTFRKVFVDVDNVETYNRSVDSIRRCLYVAVTRATSQVNLKCL